MLQLPALFDLSVQVVHPVVKQYRKLQTQASSIAPWGAGSGWHAGKPLPSVSNGGPSSTESSQDEE
jgi:hypothetical protein